ncbi:tetratricopeptide repeat protein [Candidatus Poribacteria bacterium]|nr:tetratricopeptide repeat protein [Candidatus Poribacteria bacterium]MYG07990.1 tetratricopeptide repeat protein [Candidatus Poribacteria bacterium]MYK22491.1 tetratricopeptide repeat protein [Candidatus Poribacteria bacterium]
MFQKGLSSAVFLCVVFVNTAWNAAAQAPQELYADGMQAVRQGKYQQALQNLQRAVALQPAYAKAHAAMGTIYLQLGDFPESEKALTLALNIDPNLIQAEANLAVLYTKTEHLDDAIRVYQNLIRRQPESLQVRLGIASAYQQAERFPEAIEAYLESLKQSPNLAAAMTNLASCYEAVEDDEQAVRYYKAALAVEPNLPMANGNLGAIYQEQGELDRALPLLETAIRQNPQFTAARYRLGLVLTKKREFQRAAAEYQRVIAQKRDHVGAYYNLAQALFRLKKPEEGKRAMEAYHRLNEIAQEIDTRERATLMVGVALSEDGAAENGMGTAFGDWNNDGWFDLTVTNYAQQTNTLYHNNADGFFTDATATTKTAQLTYPYLDWATVFIDYDNDGYQDLFVANGHLHENLAELGQQGTYGQRNLLFRNNYNGTFTEISETLGHGMKLEDVSRGATSADYDSDGDIDIVVTNSNTAPRLLRNDGGNQKNYLQIRLIATKGTTDAIGSRVKITTGELTQTREVRSGDGYLSQRDLMLHFGVADYAQIDSIEIQWQSEAKQLIKSVPANQVLSLKENRDE